MSQTYRTIIADPPWREVMAGAYKGRHKRPSRLPYPTMTIAQIAALPVADLAADDCHLWLWTTNRFIEAGFEVLKAWGFTYLAPIHWIKPSGFGNYFIHRTQTILFGYRRRCLFPNARYIPNIITANPRRHSQKPEEFYALVESVSNGPRLELFARPYTDLFPKRPGWHVWGNEVAADITLTANTQGASNGPI